MLMEISLIIPAYNEEKRILNTLVKTIEYMESNFSSYEIIVVNDGSCDKTADMAEAFRPYIRLISYEKNCGKGYAVSKGVEAAEGDFIFFTDADLSYNPGYILQGEKLLKEGAEIVVGQRDSKRTDYPALRRKMSRVYNRAAKQILPISIGDTQCGFKGFRNGAAKTLFKNLKVFGFGFDTEILCRAELYNMEIASVPVSFEHRGGSRINLFGSAKMLRDLYRIRRELFD